MSVVGEDFKHNVRMSGGPDRGRGAMKAGMAVLKPLLTSKDGGTKPKGVLLMGTVAATCTISVRTWWDDGRGAQDLSARHRVIRGSISSGGREKHNRTSSHERLLTTTMMYMKTVIEGFHAAATRRSRCGGRAPISQMFATRMRRWIRSQCFRSRGFIPAAVRHV